MCCPGVIIWRSPWRDCYVFSWQLVRPPSSWWGLRWCRSYCFHITLAVDYKITPDAGRITDRDKRSIDIFFAIAFSGHTLLQYSLQSEHGANLTGRPSRFDLCLVLLNQANCTTGCLAWVANNFQKLPATFKSELIDESPRKKLVAGVNRTER
jgi:hypothetical protein